MINLICKGVEKIVSSGVDGKVLVPLLIILLWVVMGQVEEVVSVTREVFKEVRTEKSPYSRQAK